MSVETIARRFPATNGAIWQWNSGVGEVPMGNT